MGDQAQPAPQGVVTLFPNAITLAGYAATIGWLLGGSPLLAIAGLLADELDGRVARATRTTSELGEKLDWATDLTLTGLVAARVGLLPVLPLITLAQAKMKADHYRPAVGSARAGLTLYALLLKGG